MAKFSKLDLYAEFERPDMTHGHGHYTSYLRKINEKHSTRASIKKLHSIFKQMLKLSKHFYSEIFQFGD